MSRGRYRQKLSNAFHNSQEGCNQQFMHACLVLEHPPIIFGEPNGTKNSRPQRFVTKKYSSIVATGFSASPTVSTSRSKFFSLTMTSSGGFRVFHCSRKSSRLKIAFPHGVNGSCRLPMTW